jgi:uncharacterized protein YgiM (DUF1202 family)
MELQDASGKMADHWRLQEDDAATDWQPVEYSRPPRSRPNWILPSLIGVALVAVVGYLVWFGINRFGPELAFWSQPSPAATEEVISGTEGVGEDAGEGAGQETEGTPAEDPDAVAAQPQTPEVVASPTPQAPPTPTSAPPTPTPVMVEERIATIRNQYGVNARQEPTLDAEVLRILEQGETVVVLDERADPQIEGTWLQVQLSEGAIAWISSDFVDISTQLVEAEPGEDTSPAPPSESGEVAGVGATAPVTASVTISSPAGLNARTSPSPTADIVATLANGASFTALQLSEDGQWVQVELEDGSQAWVFREFAISDDDLSLLPAAGAESVAATTEITTTEAATATETITEPVTDTPDAASDEFTVVVSSTFGVNARATADPTANVLRVLPNNAEVPVTGRTADARWLQVELDDGRAAWVLTSSVLIDGDVQSLPVVEPPGLPPTEDAPETTGEATATVTSLIGTNARAAPNTSQPTIQAIPNGAVLPVLGRSADGQWVQVTLDDGTVAWLFTNNVQLNVALESLDVTE